MRDYATELEKTYRALAPSYDTRWRHYLNRTHEKSFHLLEARPGMKILDVACGTGQFLELAARNLNSSVLMGIDANPAMLEEARKRISDSHMLMQASAYDIPAEDHSFDRIVCLNSFHYFERPEKALKEMQRVMKPDGKLILTDWCANRTSHVILKIGLTTIRHPYNQIFSADQIQSTLKALGFDTNEIHTYFVRPIWALFSLSASLSKSNFQ